jgi:hypothetical protein
MPPAAARRRRRASTAIPLRSVGDHTHEKDLPNPVLFQLEVHVGVGEAVLRLVFVDEDVTGLRHEIRMPLPGPSRPPRKPLLPCTDLALRELPPAFVVAGPPAPMLRVKYLDVRGPGRPAISRMLSSIPTASTTFFANDHTLPPSLMKSLYGR